MLTTSQHMDTRRCSSTWARMCSATFGSRSTSFSRGVLTMRSASRLCSSVHQAEIIRIGAQLFAAGFGDEEIVFEAQSAATGPINAGLDGENHIFSHGDRGGLMREWGLMRACSHTVSNRMGRLAGIAAFGDSGANKAVQLSQTRAVARMLHCLGKNS